MSWQFFPGNRFADHALEWDALQSATTDTPFLESAFIQPLLETFGTGSEVLALHRTEGGLTAATLLQPAGLGRWQTFQPSQLPLGPWVSGRSEPMPLAHKLVSALPGLSLGVGLTQLDPRLHDRPPPQPDVNLIDYIESSYIDVTGSFDAYWEGRGKNLRQNLRKQHNKLVSEGTVARLECVTDPAGVPATLADYGALESAGWKAGTGTAIHPDNAQGRFYTRMLQNFCAAGRGRLYTYRFGEQAVAMDLCIDNGPMVVILKTAYDESIRTVSPSTLMRHEQFRAWWGEGRFRRIEFYGKTMEWHTRWTVTQRTLYHANVYRWPLLRRVHEHLMRRRASGTEVGASTIEPQAVPGAAVAPALQASGGR